MLKYPRMMFKGLAISTGLLAAAGAAAQGNGPLTIAEQGSFAVGGSVTTTPGT